MKNHIHCKDCPEIDIEHMLEAIINMSLLSNDKRLEKLQEAFKEPKKLNNTKIITLEISDIIKDVLIYSSPEHFEEDKI